MRLRPLQLNIIKLNIHLLVIEAQVPGNLRALVRRIAIIPHQVLVHLLFSVSLTAAHHNIIVTRHALVRTLRLRLAAPQRRRISRGGRQVIPHRQPRLVEVERRGGLRDLDAPVREHLDGPRRRQDLDALERVLGVHVDPRVLLKPGVRGAELDSDVAPELVRLLAAAVGVVLPGVLGAEPQDAVRGAALHMQAHDAELALLAGVVQHAPDEGRHGDVVVGVIWMLPHVERRGCVGYIDAVEEDADAFRRVEDLVGAFLQELSP